MENKKVFGYFSLRVCVFALSFGFFYLAWSIILVNVLDYNNSPPIGVSMAAITTCLIIVVWGMALYGAILAMNKPILAATILWSMFVIFWLMLVLVSSVGGSGLLLINHRGPESFWLMPNVYNRDEFSINYEYYDPQLPIIRCMKSTEKRSPKEADEPHVEMSTTQTVDMEYMKWILILINFSVFAYLVFGSWYILYNFYKEIDYIVECECPAVCSSTDMSVNV